MKTMTHDPLGLVELPGALSVEQCERLILLFGPSVQRSLVRGQRLSAAAQLQSGTRTSSSAKVPCAALPRDVRESLLERVATTCGLPVEHQEPWEIIRYEVGQQYHPHFDFVPEPGASGQRLYSALVFLRAPEAGGETAFHLTGQQVTPEPGKLLVWSNTIPGTEKLLAISLHSANPVQRGEKWSFAGWIRARPYEVA